MFSVFEGRTSFEEVWNNNFICTGRFELYSDNLQWECCMDDVKNLVFRADTCRLELKEGF
jgi:hypothetical protein